MGKKVCVALSGGIDSAFCALLLKEKGYSLAGITLKASFFSSNSVIRAKEFCNKIDIPHYTVDVAGIFRKYVINYLVRSYLDGLTPNPCALCNREIKFSFLLKEKSSRIGKKPPPKVDETLYYL